jgi:hypothetical protein
VSQRAKSLWFGGASMILGASSCALFIFHPPGAYAGGMTASVLIIVLGAWRLWDLRSSRS